MAPSTYTPLPRKILSFALLQFAVLFSVRFHNTTESSARHQNLVTLGNPIYLRTRASVICLAGSLQNFVLGYLDRGRTITSVSWCEAFRRKGEVISAACRVRRSHNAFVLCVAGRADSVVRNRLARDNTAEGEGRKRKCIGAVLFNPFQLQNFYWRRAAHQKVFVILAVYSSPFSQPFRSPKYIPNW